MDRIGVPQDIEDIGLGNEFEGRTLRNRLVNLTVDWELAALTMDAQRYKAHGQIERESLKDSANTYRKCVAELSEILAYSSPIAMQRSFI